MKTEADIRTLLSVCTRFAPKKLMTVMGMGPLGTLSRLVGPLFHSCLLYGYIGTPTASGQLPYRDLQERIRALYPRYDGIPGPTRNYEIEALTMKPNAHGRRFQKRLSRLKVDGYWVSHVPDLFYLTGYGAEGCWGLFGNLPAGRQDAGRRCSFPMLAVDQAAALAKGFEILPLKKLSEVYGDGGGLCRQGRMENDRLRPLPYAGSLYPGSAQSLRQENQVGSRRPGRRPLCALKRIPRSSRRCAAAGHVVIQGFNHIKRIARPGMRECDLAAEFESYIRKHGAIKSSFDSIVAAGENAAYPHYITGNRILRKNDMVLCDIGALVDGYCSDLTRTFFLGTITPLGRKVYDTVARAQKLAIQAVKPGVKAAQIDRIARDEIERAGYGRRFIHSTGHGVGVEIHEAPWVSAASQDVLEAGMIITVEPGIYLQGWGGVRIEDTLLVTEDGIRNFNEMRQHHD